MLIRNYGLFWRKDWVFWGSGPKSGHLKGVPARNRTAEPVDFRRQQGVYVLYDDTFKIVYVGQSGGNDNKRIFDRLNDHTADKLSDRWTKFSWFGVRGVRKNGKLNAEKERSRPSIGGVLDHIEAILIAAAEPPHNRQSGRFGDDVRRYLQWRDDDNLGPLMSEAVYELWEKMQKDRRKAR